MTQASNSESEMRDEFDFSTDDLRSGVRGSYVARFQKGVNLVPSAHDRTSIIPDAEAASQVRRPCADFRPV